MDKFGIFKLLNSFLNFYQQNKGNSTSNGKENSSLGLSNMLSSLLTKNADDSNLLSAPKKEEKPLDNLKIKAPLQQSMLSIMNEHDKFVKRVKENNFLK